MNTDHEPTPFGPCEGCNRIVAVAKNKIRDRTPQDAYRKPAEQRSDQPRNNQGSDYHDDGEDTIPFSPAENITHW